MVANDFGISMSKSMIKKSNTKLNMINKISCHSFSIDQIDFGGLIIEDYWDDEFKSRNLYSNMAQEVLAYLIDVYGHELGINIS